MLVNISSAPSSVQESLTSLRFAESAMTCGIGKHRDIRFQSSTKSAMPGHRMGLSSVVKSKVRIGKLRNLEQLVTDFFEDLPSSTIVCITFLGGDNDVLLREILPSSSSSAWMLLSRLNVYHKPIVKILPMDLIVEDAAANSGLESICKGSTSGTKWRCPWDYTMVDDLAPQFKTILEEICLSADVLPDSLSALKAKCYYSKMVAVKMFPWENLPALRKQKQEVYRMPSFGSIFSAIKINCCLEEQIGGAFPSFPLIDPLDTFYLLNPSCDLEDAQKEFEEWFKDQNLKGIAGKVSKVEELASALKDHDLFIYIGHGNGMQYIPWYEIQKVEICVATVLTGCCSGSICYKGCYNPQGAVISYLLAGSTVMITNLWDVTFPDIDRFGRSMLNAMFEKRSTSS
ncbi:hypothetical protein GIB67_002646, partial [Kingdonia uniflora]